MSVICSISKGDVPLEISWTLNDKIISLDHNDIIINTGKRHSTLTIDSVAARHWGTYECKASNKFGSADYRALLTVNGTITDTMLAG